MLSIIICHRNEHYLDAITKNIKNTIGINYELIVINNSKNMYSIFEAYNLGVSKSNYELICFTHEDVLFHTQNWGQKVVEHFKDSSIGMIGVIGGNVFPKSPSPWWSSEILNNHLINVIQHWQKGISNSHYQQILSQNNDEIITIQYNNPTNQNIVDAVVLDGALFYIRKKMFNEGLISFDTETFNGFHCYDSDISLQVKKYLRVCVVYDILVEHFQQGTINKSWFESVIALNRKWRNSLPISSKKIDNENYPLYEWETLRTFVYWMESHRYSEAEIKSIIVEIAPLLPKSVDSIKVSNELIYRAKYGKYISKVINKLKSLYL